MSILNQLHIYAIDSECENRERDSHKPINKTTARQDVTSIQHPA